MGVLSSSLEASRTDLVRVKTSLQESVLEKEALALKLSEAEKSATNAVHTFKSIHAYQELLKDNTLLSSGSFVKGSPRTFHVLMPTSRSMINFFSRELLEFIGPWTYDLPDPIGSFPIGIELVLVLGLARLHDP
ncbi:hypothetical protein LIER_19703 [Lithospermum erythrorhizon]|uniref:Uncharacterized protein n=1 Tax=Lithospermum erythrorhizon TaxID=34254 RepID=A0AAV3QIP0_LITER